MVKDSRKTLASAVEALMVKQYGKVNLTRLGREVVKSPATAKRLVEGETSIGVELVDQIAKYFRVEPWHLLVPGFDPNNPPQLVEPQLFTEKFSVAALEIAREFDARPDGQAKRRLYARLLSVLAADDDPGKAGSRGSPPADEPMLALDPPGKTRRGKTRVRP